jgi:hypothetical protein
MKSFCLTALIAVLILSTNESINGQITVDGYSINPKLGAGIFPSENNLSGLSGVAGVEINAFKNHIIYALDYYHHEEFVLFADPAEKYNQIDFLIGKYIGDRLFRFQYQGGLGTFWGFKRGDKTGTNFDHKKDNFFTIGIPLKLGFKVIPSRFISIGIDFLANINFEKPTNMALISLEFGKLRDKSGKP